MGRKISNLRVFKSLNRREINVINMNFWMKRFFWKICLFLRRPHRKNVTKKLILLNYKCELYITPACTIRGDKRGRIIILSYIPLWRLTKVWSTIGSPPNWILFLTINWAQQQLRLKGCSENLFFTELRRINTTPFVLEKCYFCMYTANTGANPKHHHHISMKNGNSSSAPRSHRVEYSEHTTRRTLNTTVQRIHHSLSRCLVLKPSLIPGQRRWRPHRWLSFP